MHRLISACAVAAALAVPAAAQDTTVKSRTDIKADDATVVALTGCLQKNSDGRRFTLIGSMAAAGDEVTTHTKVETDVDDDEVEVKAKTRAKADERVVGTSGRTATFLLVPKDGLALASHVGHRVQLSAVMLDPGEDDAEIEIDDRTTVDADGAPDRTKRSKTEVEIEDARHGEYTVVSVKPLPGSCPAF